MSTHLSTRLVWHEKNKSLLFLYCNNGNPLDESESRILLGVSRIPQIGPQLYFGKKLSKFPDKYPIWSRCITHAFEKQDGGDGSIAAEIERIARKKSLMEG